MEVSTESDKFNQTETQNAAGDNFVYFQPHFKWHQTEHHSVNIEEGLYLSRHIAREKAFQMLFQLDVGGNSLEMARLTLEEAQLSEAEQKFAMSLVNGTLEHQKEFDRLISRFSEEWELDRIANVDKNAMRLALYEMKYVDDVPPTVAIDEAIELVKLFGSEDSGKFVNGILDTIRKDTDFLENLDTPCADDPAAGGEAEEPAEKLAEKPEV